MENRWPARWSTPPTKCWRASISRVIGATRSEFHRSASEVLQRYRHVCHRPFNPSKLPVCHRDLRRPPGVRRRATVLGGPLREEVHLTDADPDDCVTGAPGRWIIDPDGAIVRAGLVRQYAHRHGLWQLDPDIAYLTGDVLPDGVRGFEVLDQLPLREKVLRQALSARNCGSLEILVRGVDVDPDALRRRLRPSGSDPMSMVIMRSGSGAAARAVAFICRPSR